MKFAHVELIQDKLSKEFRGLPTGHTIHRMPHISKNIQGEEIGIGIFFVNDFGMLMYAGHTTDTTVFDGMQ